MAESGACEVVVAEFIYGPMLCGDSGTKKVPDDFEGAEHFICDDHFKIHLFDTKPDIEDYEFVDHRDEPDYDPDDWDEELYHDDVRAWEKIRDQK